MITNHERIILCWILGRKGIYKKCMVQLNTDSLKETTRELKSHWDGYGTFQVAASLQKTKPRSTLEGKRKCLAFLEVDTKQIFF